MFASAAHHDDDDDSKLPAVVYIDEKENQVHMIDSLSLLLYVFLLTLTVLTIWLFKHRRIRYLHETGLALIFGILVGALLRYCADDFTQKLTNMRVRPLGTQDMVNGTRYGPPDVLWLEAKSIYNQKARDKLLNKTLAYRFKGEVNDNDIDQKATFDPEIFINILLPPIIFNAGYSMKKRFFFRNIGSILAFAFIGTTVSTFTVGGIVYGFSQAFPHLHYFSWLDSIRFGALISATDPVTCLAIFSDLHVDVNLHALVFGESVLNDAVALVITRTLEDYEENLVGSEDSGSDATSAYMTSLKSLGEFVGVFGASFLVGSVMGCATALITKFTRISHFPQLETTLFILMSYSTFLIAEVLRLTGIVAVLFCGICQAHYTYNNLSDESRSTTKQFFGLLNFMAENFIFSYIGVSIFTFPNHNFDPAFIFASFVGIIVGRAVNVYPLSFLLNLRRKTKISLNMQHMLFLSGLRGAIAFALAIRNTLTAARQVILTTTLVIVLVTVIVSGGSTLSLLTFLGIPLGVNHDDDDDVAGVDLARVRKEEHSPLTTPNRATTSHYRSVLDDVVTGAGSGDTAADQATLPSQPATSSLQDKSLMARLWSQFDVQYMKPLLTHNQPTLMETLPACCLPLGKMLTSTEQLAHHPAMKRSNSIGTEHPAFVLEEGDNIVSAFDDQVYGHDASMPAMAKQDSQLQPPASLLPKCQL